MDTTNKIFKPKVTNMQGNISTTTLKALAILEVVAASGQSISISEVAEKVHVDRSTAYRMLSTLQVAGYIIQDETTKRFKLSYKVISLSRNLMIDNEVSSLFHRTMIAITDATQETVGLSVLDGLQTVLVQQVRGTQRVNVAFQVGDRSELHCTSIGKLLIAYQDPPYVEKVIANGLVKHAVNTHTDPKEFRIELQRIRSQGYSFDNQELADDMRCVAVPIFESGGRVTRGFSISGPATRFTLDKLEELKIPMLEAAHELSIQLGGMPWVSKTLTK
jgi:IclR family transcriptional regulator, KDG regulon repressor